MRAPSPELERSTSAPRESRRSRARWIAACAPLLSLLLSGCLRVRETFELAADLSGRVVIELWMPSAFLPSGETSANLRLATDDLVLPEGVELRRHAVDEDTRANEVRFELALAFRSLDQLAGVALRYPGSKSPHGIHPWRGLAVRRTPTKIEIERAAYGIGEITPELLASRPEGRLAAAAFRWTSIFVFDPSTAGRWLAPRGGWQSLPRSERLRWSRVRSWGEQLREGPEPLRALLPLGPAESAARLGVGLLRGLLGAAPWVAIAVLLAIRRPRFPAARSA